MNEIFLIGQVISKIEYKFVVNSKKLFSKATFKIKVQNQEIKIKGYNEIADLCYRKLKEGSIIIMNGKIETDGEIAIKQLDM